MARERPGAEERADSGVDDGVDDGPGGGVDPQDAEHPDGYGPPLGGGSPDGPESGPDGGRGRVLDDRPPTGPPPGVPIDPTRTGPAPWGGPFPPGRRIAADGLRARSRRGAFATTWWGRRFVDQVEAVAGAGRVARGRTYARAGQVLGLDVASGGVRARVQGSRPTPYETRLAFHTWDAETQDDLAEAVAGSPAVLAEVLGGRMPEGFEQLCLDAGLELFPESLADVRFSCTCPDLGDPCKHAAAVVYLLAEWLDGEPFGVLTLRGVRRDELLARVAVRRRAHDVADAGAAAVGGDPGAGGDDGDGADAGGAGPSGPPVPSGPGETPLEELVDAWWGPRARMPRPPHEDGPPGEPGARRTVLDDLDATLLGPGGEQVADRLRPLYAVLRGAPPHRRP